MRSAITVVIYALLILPLAVVLHLLLPIVPFVSLYLLIFWAVFTLFIVPYLQGDDLR